MSGCAVGGADFLANRSAIPVRTLWRNATAVWLCSTPSSIVELRRFRRRNKAFAWIRQSYPNHNEGAPGPSLFGDRGLAATNPPARSLPICRLLFAKAPMPSASGWQTRTLRGLSRNTSLAGGPDPSVLSKPQRGCEGAPGPSLLVTGDWSGGDFHSAVCLDSRPIPGILGVRQAVGAASLCAPLSAGLSRAENRRDSWASPKGIA